MTATNEVKPEPHYARKGSVCRWCKSSLNPDAVVCNHCGRHQGLAGQFAHMGIFVGVVVAIIGAFVSVNQALEVREDRLAVENALAMSKRNLDLISKVWDVTRSETQEAEAVRFREASNRALVGLAELKANCNPAPEHGPEELACLAVYSDVLSSAVTMKPTTDEQMEFGCKLVNGILELPDGVASSCGHCEVDLRGLKSMLQASHKADCFAVDAQ